MISSPIYAPVIARYLSDEKLLAKIDRRIAELEERIKYALGNAQEVAECGDELQVLRWAKTGAPEPNAPAITQTAGTSSISSAEGRIKEDVGPWRIVDETNGATLYSEDFEHDVTISITGDFADGAQRMAYAENVARRLSAPHSASGASKFSDFIRNATPEEKEAVYTEVMQRATERQKRFLPCRATWASVTLQGAAWYCNTCGASDKRPECKAP